MTQGTLPAELIGFLNQYIHSIRQLEALLFFFSHKNEELTSLMVSKALAADSEATEKWLTVFHNQGFLSAVHSSPVLFQYKPGTPDLERLVALLASEYKIRPLKVIDVIVNRPTQNMMSFMHAFKISKEDKDDDS